MDSKRICIIGAGAAGLAALKAILDSHQYKTGLWTPVAFEARSKPGGIWIPGPPTDDPPETPLYDSLTTNLPHPIMAFSSLTFPPSTYLFPRAKAVEDYLQSYAETFQLFPHIHLNTKVISVHRSATGWQVVVSGSSEPLHFDYVIVCNGHYNKPRYPFIAGLEDWLEAKTALHSIYFRNPEGYHDKVVLVIGAGPSGLDLVSDLKTTAARVIHSVRGSANQDLGKVQIRGLVRAFHAHGQVEFVDGSIETGVDYCLLATGYEMSFPFLSSSTLTLENPPAPISNNLPSTLYNSSYSVYPLAKHVFPLFQSQFPGHTLAFIGLAIKVAPLPLIEAQAHAIVHVFTHPDALDVEKESQDILDRYNRLDSKTDDPLAVWKTWHKFNDDPDIMEFSTYRDDLYDLASSSSHPSTPRIRVQDWEREMYLAKFTLRKLWVEMEKTGKADELVKGVGENGIEEWVAFMRKLLRMAKEKEREADL